MWQVVALGGGPQELSLVGALTAAGTLAATLPGGAPADRLPQRHLLPAVTLLSAAPVAGVAVLSLAGALPLGLPAAAGLLGGVAPGLHHPAYSALVPALLPREELLAANGLEGAMRPVLAAGARRPHPAARAAARRRGRPPAGPTGAGALTVRPRDRPRRRRPPVRPGRHRRRRGR